nr:transposase [Enterococcus sp. DIV2402]
MCKRKDIEIIQANACRDYIHLLVSFPAKIKCIKFYGIYKIAV